MNTDQYKEIAQKVVDNLPQHERKLHHLYRKQIKYQLIRDATDIELSDLDCNMISGIVDDLLK